MTNLATLLTAEQFFAFKTSKRIIKKLNHLDYMELAEDYADYVCTFEKFIDNSGMKSIEKLEKNIRKFGRKKAFSM